MKMKTLDDLFAHEVKDLISAEKQLLKALPRMVKAATSEDLRSAIEDHLAQTEDHLSRLEQIADDLGIATRGTKCAAMEGLLEEGKGLLEEDMVDDVRDAALISSAQRVEHYEIAAYGCARTFAALLGHTKAAQLLEQTLDEEKAADEKLTEIAMAGVNVEAADGDA